MTDAACAARFRDRLARLRQLVDEIERLVAGDAANDDAGPQQPAWAEVRDWFARRTAVGEAGTAKADRAAAAAAFGQVVPRDWIRELRAEFRPAGGRRRGRPSGRK